MGTRKHTAGVTGRSSGPTIAKAVKESVLGTHKQWPGKRSSGPTIAKAFQESVPGALVPATG